MKRILIICNYFAPDNKIAAVRITKMAKYFYQYGYKVFVITEKRQETTEDEILKKDAEGINVIHVENSMRMKKLHANYQSFIAPIKGKKYNNLNDRRKINKKTGKYEFYTFQTRYPFIASIDFLMETLRQYNLFLMSKNLLSEYIGVDYVFTSYGNLFGIFAGAHLHKRNGGIRWISDIRDPICDYKFTPQYMRWLMLLFEKYTWKKADIITAVSKGLCQRVPKKYQYKVHCITNGYDRNDREGLVISNKNHKKMRLTYTGAMHGGLYNLSPVFNNIKLLIQNKEMDIEKIEFCFAGSETSYKVFESQARKYGLNHNCVYHGKLTRIEALKLQMESDILMVSSFDYQADRVGVITGKALEYMSANKPIIAIINGDIDHSELGEIIRNINLGFAYEEAHHIRDEKLLYQYLLKKYKEFIEKGRLEHSPREKILEKYEYKYLGEKMIRIIEKC